MLCHRPAILHEPFWPKFTRNPCGEKKSEKVDAETGAALPSVLPDALPSAPSNAHMAGMTESVGDGWIECREVANDGREKWAVYSPTGARLTSVWGKDKAEAACKEYLETGTITR